MICDHVIAEQETNKKTLVGTFNNIKLPQVPGVYHAFSVFASLTNGQGAVRLILRCTSVTADQVQFEVAMDSQFPDPSHVAEFIFNLLNVPFSATGIHCLELIVDEEPILETRFTVNIA